MAQALVILKLSVFRKLKSKHLHLIEKKENLLPSREARGIHQNLYFSEISKLSSLLIQPILPETG